MISIHIAGADINFQTHADVVNFFRGMRFGQRLRVRSGGCLLEAKIDELELDALRSFQRQEFEECPTKRKTNSQ